MADESHFDIWSTVLLPPAVAMAAIIKGWNTLDVAAV
jgi:hypothetical protein